MSKKAVFAWDGGFYSLTERIFDFIMLNLLWLLFSLPIITMGASTAAFYYTAVKVLRKDRGHLWDEFWGSFKANLRGGAFFSILFFVLFWVLQFNMGYTSEISTGDFGIFLICLYSLLSIIVTAIACYSLASLSRFNMNVGWLLKIGIYMTFRYIFSTIAIVGIVAACTFIIILIPVLIFVLPCGGVLCVSFVMERILKKHTPEPENEQELEYKWYR